MRLSCFRRTRVIPYFERTNSEGCQTPRGTLINYIFTGSSYDRQSTLEVGGIIQHPPEFCGSKISQSFKFTNGSQNSSEKKTKFLTKFHIVDNDKLMIITTSCPWHDPPKSAHCGREVGTKAQYPSPQTEPAARVKQQTLSIKNTQQDLTEWDYKISTPRVRKFSREGCRLH